MSQPTMRNFNVAINHWKFQFSILQVLFEKIEIDNLQAPVTKKKTESFEQKNLSEPGFKHHALKSVTSFKRRLSQLSHRTRVDTNCSFLGLYKKSSNEESPNE